MTFLSETQHVLKPDQKEPMRLPLAAPAVASVLTLAAFVTPASAHYVNGEYREDVTDANCASTPGCAGEAPLQQQANPTDDSSGGAGGELASIRACESGGNYSTDTGNGYGGAYQFDQSTWTAAGGSGSPASASASEQDRVAAAWIAKGHRDAWPNC